MYPRDTEAADGRAGDGAGAATPGHSQQRLLLRTSLKISEHLLRQL